MTHPVDQLAPALDRLGDVLESELDELSRDAALHRFQLCFELCWKSVQQRLQERDLDCASPMGCLQVAVRQGWLVEEPWLQMIEARNMLPSSTDESIASAIATDLPNYLERMRELREALTDSV